MTACEKKGIDASLVFVGTGALRPDLEAYTRQNKIPDVYFLGFHNQSDLPGIYALSDVFVLPSENEPWGLVINEAMCAGLPIVASESVGAVADLVRHGDNGYRFEVGDVNALADHLQRLVTRPDLCLLMGERSEQIINHWDLDACVQGIYEALQFVTKN